MPINVTGHHVNGRYTMPTNVHGPRYNTDYRKYLVYALKVLDALYKCNR